MTEGPKILPPALLDNRQLDRITIAHLTELARNKLAPSTERNYNSALTYWRAWYCLRYHADDMPMPLSPAVVLQFLSDHVALTKKGYTTLPIELADVLKERGLRVTENTSLSSIRRYIAAITWWHSASWSKKCGWTPPTEDPEVKGYIQKLTGIYKRHNRALLQKSAAKLDQLDAMLLTCDQDLAAEPLAVAWRQRERTMAAHRDRALLLFGWTSGGRRRSEIATADMESLTRTTHDGQLAYTYRLGETKTTDEEDPTIDKPIKGTAAEALETWLMHTGIHSGRIFRSVAGGKLSDALSDRGVARIVQRRAQRAGLPGNWGGHSLRAGFITQGNLDGIADAEIMALTDHRTVQQLVRYHRESAGLVGKAGSMYDDRKKKTK